MTIGTRVFLTQPVDIYPHGLWMPGETGVLTEIDAEGSHWIKLDKHYPALDEWDNQIHIWDWSKEDGIAFHPSSFYQIVDDKEDPARIIHFDYVNYRGEGSSRKVLPISIRFGTSKWHPEAQWLLLAFDLDKGAAREFAMLSMSSLRKGRV